MFTIDDYWEKTPASIKQLVEKMGQYIKQSEKRLADLEAKQQELLEKINCTSKNSSIPPSSVAILRTRDASGEKSCRAIAGDKHSIGKTAGQALDVLTTQLGETKFSVLLVIQSFETDTFFSAQQQERLSELMRL